MAAASRACRSGPHPPRVAHGPRLPERALAVRSCEEVEEVARGVRLPEGWQVVPPHEGRDRSFARSRLLGEVEDGGQASRARVGAELRTAAARHRQRSRQQSAHARRAVPLVAREPLSPWLPLQRAEAVPTSRSRCAAWQDSAALCDQRIDRRPAPREGKRGPESFYP